MTPRRGLAAVLLGAVLAVLALGVLEFSGSARRTLATDGVQVVAFVAILPHSGIACQSGVSLPPGAAYARVLVASQSHPLPGVELVYRGSDGRQLDSGRFAPGHGQGYIDIPIRPGRASAAGTLCLRFGGHERLYLGGHVESVPATVEGRAAQGAIGVAFLTADRLSWWQLLPTLARRFTYAKAGWVGGWTLALLALIMLVVWASALRLLWRLVP